MAVIASMSASVASRIKASSGGIRNTEIGLAAGLRQGTDPADISLPLNHADHAACVQQVEQVARLDALLVGRQRQLAIQKRAAFALGILEVDLEPLSVGG